MTAEQHDSLPALRGPYRILPGWPHPLGATADENGVNFSVYCGQATSVELLIFSGDAHSELVQTIVLDPMDNRTFLFWHVYLLGAPPGMQYAYRVDGSHDLQGDGDRYNRDKVLIDPYARTLSMTRWNRAAACSPGDNLATALRGIVVDLADYDWEGDHPLNVPMENTIIYELHVGGFTRSPSSGCRHPGTFIGLIEKIPYLKSLGITAVELMPTCQFDAQEIDRMSPVDGRPLTNYWGYNTINFFTPHHAYCVSAKQVEHVREFRDMVKALHRAGIEVILDVVFNHTGESDHRGPTISFRGFDNSTYYYLQPHDHRYYLDYSGCGNTVQCNHPIVQKLIVDCLEFWVREMHVDGFRFDEGSILSRGEDGEVLRYPPVIWSIELADSLADVKVIVEAWDAAGLYQVGYFPGRRWAEWNGRFRDDVRRFVRGDPGLVGAVAYRVAGSADLYQARGELPINSVNFVTCHDGFTLNDLVSYNQKHNLANGEQNRDGMDENLSWNCGMEGATTVPEVELLRERQIKNVFTIILLSRGVPMLLAGDEVRRTQGGNNNAYCQNNETSWFDWTLAARYPGLLRFVQRVIAFRKHHASLHRRGFFTGQPTSRGRLDISWHGCHLDEPDWHDPTSRVLAFTLGATETDIDIHVMMNMDGGDRLFEVPRFESLRWYRAIDTALSAPDDVAGVDAAPLHVLSTYLVHSHSIVVLVSG